MNNQGWGLRSMLFLCSILIGSLLVIAIIVYNFLSSNFKQNGIEIKNSQIDETRTYNSMELEMITATKKYIKKTYNKLYISSPLYISVNSLKQEKLLNILYDIKDNGLECSGYVKIKKTTEIRYEPYMKCGKNYITKGYNEKFDK